jgi:hypothetical protein
MRWRHALIKLTAKTRINIKFTASILYDLYHGSRKLNDDDIFSVWENLIIKSIFFNTLCILTSFAFIWSFS